MNSIVSPQSRRSVQSRFQPVFALAAGITLTVSIGLAAGSDHRSGGGQSFVPPETSAAANVAAYRSAEQQGLVPDEFAGGFRPARNLRERLQAERGEFSASLR